MKKPVALTAALTLALALVLAACGTPKVSENDLGLLNAGKFSVGMEIGYPPFEYFADGTTPAGLDVELAKAIAGKLGAQVEFIDTQWDGIFDGLDVNKYDVVMSAATISGERLLKMDFSDPYIENWQSIVVKTGAAPVAEPAGLSGLKVGYQGSTTSDDYINRLIELGKVSCETNSYEKIMQAFDDLKLGRLDAVICDSTVTDGYLARDPGVFTETWNQSNVPGDEAELFGVAIKKGNAKLLEAVNGALKELKADGTLDKIVSENLK